VLKARISTNAEQRIGRVRKVMSPKNGYGDWEITVKLAEAMGVPMNYSHPSEIMDEIAATTPSFAGVSFAKLDEVGSVQWPCNEKAPEGTPIMHIGGFKKGKGKFVLTEYVPTDERTGPRYPPPAHDGAHPQPLVTSDFGPGHRELPRIFANPKESQPTAITQLLFRSVSQTQTARILAQRRPDRGTIDKSSANRDYRCSHILISSLIGLHIH